MPLGVRVCLPVEGDEVSFSVETDNSNQHQLISADYGGLYVP